MNQNTSNRDADTEEQRPSMKGTYWSDIVRLLVGAQEKVYRIHKDRLYARIPSFVARIADSTPKIKEQEVKIKKGIEEVTQEVTEKAAEEANEKAAKEETEEATREVPGEYKEYKSDDTPSKASNEHLKEDIVTPPLDFTEKQLDHSPNHDMPNTDEETTIYFPDEDVACWDILMKWVYHNTLPDLKIDHSKPSGWSWDPFGFYVLVDKLEIPELKDKTISALQKGQAKCRLWHTNIQTDWTWEHISPGCGMRRYLALGMVRNILVYRDPKSPNPNQRFTLPTDDIAKLLSKYPDLLLAVLSEMRGGDGSFARDPRTANPCEFHEHWPRKTCEGGAINGVSGIGEKQGNVGDEDNKPKEQDRKRVVKFV